jgi:raffinose/stachyose/melibiose transport system permease protein
VMVLLGSLRPNKQILAEPLGLPGSFDLSNYQRAWQTASLSTYFLNSVIVTVGAVALCVSVSVMAAYPLARWQFRGRSLLSVYFLSGLMLPVKLGVLPLFYMFQSMHLIDSRLGLILLYAAGGIPFSVFVLAAFIRNLPKELEEAARIDGAGEANVFRSVILPLVRPALATVIVFQFAPTWNDFFFPLVLLRSSDHYTIPVGLTRFFGEYSTDRGALYAGLVLAVLPLVVMFVLATRHIVAGLTAGISK